MWTLLKRGFYLGIDVIGMQYQGAIFMKTCDCNMPDCRIAVCVRLFCIREIQFNWFHGQLVIYHLRACNFITGLSIKVINN